MLEQADPILAAAEARRDELAQELQKVRDFIASYHAFARMAKADSVNIIGTLEATVADALPVDNEVTREAESPDAAPARRTRVTDNPKPAAVVAAAVEVIREAKRPMTRREIHRALAERDLIVRGADPIKALGTMLWRSGKDVLVQVEGEGYWIKGEPLPPQFDTAHDPDAPARLF